MTNRDILVTKLGGMATRHDLVARPRLAAPFDLAPFNRLSLICAQAGYGKTTLAASWLPNRPEQAAWLSLDRDDNDPARFLAHLVAAIRQREPHFEPGLARILQSPNPPPVATLMTGLVNALAGLDRRLILVLDDYHLIGAQAVHQSMRFLLDHQPPNLHLVIASREEPPFSLARLHSHGRLTKIAEADLCFTQPEAREFFNRMMKLDLSQQQSETLRGHTEGWAAGMQMAALSLAQGQNRTEFIAGFSGTERHVIDFLADEVLANLSEEVQRFLMRTSILDRFNADLCRTLTGAEDSQAMLLHLERSHLFLIPLDANREWYRYHHLFADLLQSRLKRSRRDQLAHLHSLAGQWYSDHQMPADAVRHAHDARNPELIARILDRHALAMFTRGEVRTVAAWLKLVPPHVILQHPRVALLAALTIYFHPVPDVALAERCLAAIDQAPAGATESPRRDHDLTGRAAVVRGYQARYGGQAALALDCFATAGKLLPEGDAFHDIAMINLAILYAALARFDEGSAILRRYAQLSDAQPHLWISMTGFAGLARIAFIRGDLRLARGICADGLGQIRERGLHEMPVCSMLHLQLAEIAYRQNRLDEAAAQAGRALELAKAGGMELNHGCSEILLARLKMARGEPAALEPRYEQRLLEFWASVTLVFPPLSGHLAQLWLMQGRADELAAWLARRGIDAATQKPELEMESLALARLMLQRRRAGEAFDLLSRLLLNAERERRHSSTIDIMILQALARQADDKLKSALGILAQALALACEHDHLRPFLDAGAGLRCLLKNASPPPPLADFAARLLDAFDVTPGQPQQPARMAVALSGKEEKIASLLVAGLSNAEIAARLFVSPNTVKFHLKSLYRKLGATKRFDAIQKIRGN